MSALDAACRSGEAVTAGYGGMPVRIQAWLPEPQWPQPPQGPFKQDAEPTPRRECQVRDGAWMGALL
jgi:hypothetical protein